MDISEKKSVVAIIPARGGSKGVPRKNIKILGGKPLVAWTIETALSVPWLERVIVSTDDAEIAEISKKWGAEVPFLRPIDFAQDDSTDLPVYQHTLQWLAEAESFYPDIVVWLRPTAPLRQKEDIENAVSKLIETKADWVRSVCLVEHHPYWMYRSEGDHLLSFCPGIDINRYMQRQLLPPVYRLNGAVDACWRTTVMEKGLLYSGDICASIMPTMRSVDIDTELDFRIAEILMKQGIQ